tara:strand:+ start:785 stop:1069 length:285 start_codon:yes stop_codon:yes gene_type:complete
MKKIKLYPRQCNITGEGMEEGFCFGDGAYYIKYESDFLKHLRTLEKESNSNKAINLSDEELREKYYNEGFYYWTEWQELDDEVNYTLEGEEVYK